MASIEKNKGKHGITYRIIVSAGYDQNCKKIRRIKSWRPPEGMSEKRAEKEVQRLACEFETQIKQGYQIDNNKTLIEYAEYVINLKEHNGIKPATIRLYRYLLRQISPALGHLKLVDIRPHHLNEFYQTLSKQEVRYTEQKVHAKTDLGALLNNRQMTREALSKQAGVSHTTITAACRGQKIMLDRAEKIAAALGEKVEDLFQAEQYHAHLSGKTVKEHHRFIRVVLAQAEREMLVPYNSADRAMVPKTTSKEVNYFQPDEITAILQALEVEPLKWRTITHLLIVTGCRRGEIMGLKWAKVDWDNHRIKIKEPLIKAPLKSHAIEI